MLTAAIGAAASALLPCPMLSNAVERAVGTTRGDVGDALANATSAVAETAAVLEAGVAVARGCVSIGVGTTLRPGKGLAAPPLNTSRPSSKLSLLSHGMLNHAESDAAGAA